MSFTPLRRSATITWPALPQRGYTGALPRRVRAMLPQLAAVLAALIAGIVGVAFAANLRGAPATPAPPILEATSAPDVQVSALPGVDLRPVTRSPGLSASSGPFPNLDTSIHFRGREAGIQLEGRPKSSSVVDRPVVVSGGWLRPGAIVLEQKLAKRLGLGAGDRVRVTTSKGTLPLVVAGTAATTAGGRYPSSSRGLAYVLPETLTRIVPNKATYGSTLMLRLSGTGDSSTPDALVKSIKARYPGAQAAVVDFRR